MRLLVVVDDPARVTADQTTAVLAWRAARRGWEVHLVGVAGLRLDERDRVVADARRLRPGRSVVDALRRLADAPITAIALPGPDVVWVRSNPARGRASPSVHAAALGLLGLACARGTCVVDPPEALRRAASKLSLVDVPPAWRPAMVVASEPGPLLAFVRARPGRTVLKPLQGTGGRDVFFVDDPDAPNLVQLVDVLLRAGPAVAQAWAEGGEAGDTRVLVLEGAPLRVDGRVAAVRRVPPPGALRSNVASGGTAARADDPARAIGAAEAVGARLRTHGVFLAGLDVVGSLVVEVNALAPGGLVDAEELEGVDFGGAVLDALAARAVGGTTPR